MLRVFIVAAGITGVFCKALLAQQPLSETVAVRLAEDDFEGAKPLLEKLVEAWRAEGSSVEARGELGRVMLSLGMVYDRTGHPARAVETLTESQKLLEVEGGADVLGDVWDALGKAYQHMFRYRDAEASFRKAIVLREGHWADVSRDHLGLLFLEMGRFGEAGKIFHETLDRTPARKTGLLGQRHAYVGRYYHALRSYGRAHQHLEKALDHAVEAWGDGAPTTLSIRADLALIYLRQGDSEKAEALLGTVIGSGGLENERPIFLSNLGEIALGGGDYMLAARRYREAIALLEERLPSESLIFVAWFNNLGCALQAAGDHTGAEEAFAKAGERMGDVLSTGHQLRGQVLQNRALNAYESGDLPAARRVGRSAVEVGLQVLDDVVTLGTERQRMNYCQRADLYSLACTLGTDAGEIADILLRTKGVVFDSVLAGGDVRKSLEPALQELDALRLSIRAVDPAAVATLEAEIRRLRGQAGPVVPPETLGWRALQALLPGGGAYIDFVKYIDYSTASWEIRYGAVVIPAEGEPVWVRLGTQAKLTRWLRAYQGIIDATVAELSGGVAAGPPPVVTLKQVLVTLERTFWKPVAEMLPSPTQMLCICPDGELHFLPFATLLDGEGDFFVTRYPSVVQVASGRDLLVPAVPLAADKNWEIFGIEKPFEKALPVGLPPTSALYPEALLAECRGMAPLGQALAEAGEIKKIAERAGYKAVIRSGRGASEKVLREQVRNPGVLHLVTHGFFLSGREGHLAGGRAGRLVDFDSDPRAFYQSGVVLHGAGRAFSTVPPPLQDDGILFAQEAAGLQLADTWIVTVSSCRSGLGTSAPGEGVLGLRRALALAGARNVLLTLWPISESSAPSFMKAFYEKAVAFKNAPAALWQTQRAELGRRCKDPKDEASLRAAVVHAGAYVLTHRGEFE